MGSQESPLVFFHMCITCFYSVVILSGIHFPVRSSSVGGLFLKLVPSYSLLLSWCNNSSRQHSGVKNQCLWLIVCSVTLVAVTDFITFSHKGFQKILYLPINNDHGEWCMNINSRDALYFTHVMETVLDVYIIMP